MSNKTQWPEIVPVTFITPEEAEERGIELPSLPVEKNLDTLTRRTLWQNWGRDDGGWTHAVRLHPFLPLVKFAISAERGYYSNFFDGRCWIVEDRPYQADFKGEPGELGLGMGNPLLSYHMGAGETPYRNNRIALSEGRSFVEWMLFECKREAWADIHDDISDAVISSRSWRAATVKVGLDWTAPDEMDAFAVADGFADAEDFFAFWRNVHGLTADNPLLGFELIQWEK